MGVEPTEDIAEMPPNGFEDRDSHRTTHASAGEDNIAFNRVSRKQGGRWRVLYCSMNNPDDKGQTHP